MDSTQITYTTSGGLELLITYEDGMITVEELGIEEVDYTEQDD